jgi:site-specific DNA-methyltransferase (adenine-specific)
MPRMTTTTMRPHFSSQRGDWPTPRELFATLDAEFNFTLDAAASATNAKHSHYFTEADDALNRAWTDRAGQPAVAFVNPPYGRRIGAWIEKAIRETRRGATVVMLVPARTDTVWFQELIEHADEIRLIAGRVTFEGATEPAPFPSAIAVLKPCQVWIRSPRAVYSLPTRHTSARRWTRMWGTDDGPLRIKRPATTDQDAPAPLRLERESILDPATNFAVHQQVWTTNMPTRTTSARGARVQNIGDGIRRDHRLSCQSSRCDCPYTFWKPRIATAPRQRARVFGTLDDARRAKRQAETTARDFRRTRSNQLAGIEKMPTLNDWYTQLLDAEWSHVRPGTLDRRRIDYQHRLRDTLGSKRLDQITFPIVRSWLEAAITKEGNRRCVQAAHETLEAMLAIAVQHDLLPDNTAKRVHYPVDGMQRREQHALTKPEYGRLLDACRDVSERTFVRVLCEAGLRRSEAVALRIDDLLLDDGLIYIQRRAYRCHDGTVDIDTPKSGKARYAAVNASLVAELREHVAGRGTDSQAPVWTRCNRYTDWRAEPLTGAAAYKLLKRIARHAGLELPQDGRSVSPHVMRATGASLAVAAGVPEHIAARQLGHARAATTRKHYLRLPVIEPLRQIGAVFE